MRNFYFKFFLLFIFPSILFGQGSLSPVTVSPVDNVVGRASIHTVQFRTTSSIPADGQIVFIYPSGFDVTTVSIASSSMGPLSVTSTSGDSVVITRTGGSATTGGNTESISLANITNTTNDGNYTITVRTKDNGGAKIDQDPSSSFTINPGSLDHFSITGVGASETAGNTFQITITAQDVYDNTATGFTSTATLSDLTGTITPTVTSSFSAGVLNNQSVTIIKTHASNTIMATSSGKAGTSSSFIVDPASLDHFEFDTITSPQTAGSWFSVTITAKDGYDNDKTDFNGTVSFSESTGTIEVQSTGTNSTPSFTGQWTGNVRITQAGENIQITGTGGGQIGTSGYFNINPASVDHFVISSISDQATGLPFAITVTAQDVYNNTATGFSGSGNTVDISHSGGGSITPAASDDFSNGIWSGNVTIAQTQTGDQITVTRSGGSETGTSNAFNVTPTTVDHFTISTIGGSQTAGSGFSVTITAEDANNNAVTSFIQTANLMDETGTNTPQQVTFSGGSWTGTVTITQSYNNNTLTVTSVGKSGTSNQFDVNPASISSFEIATITSPQSADTPFSINITAKDQYGNTATGFGGTVTISDATGTISPTSSGTFSNGTRTQTVTITQARSDVWITVNDGFGHTGTSNFFNIMYGSLNHFAISSIAAQATGVPFAVTVTAQDAYNSTVTGFTGQVTISDLTGTISPTPSGSFTDGVWNGNVTVTQTLPSNRITVTRLGGTETGTSNFFNVTPSTVDHFVITNISSPCEAGVGFTVTMTAQDANNNTVNTFSQTVNVFDETGTNAPQQVSFSNGTWTGSVTITESASNNTLTVTGMGKSGTSNQFDVEPSSVNRFEIGLVASPQRVGEDFLMTITAKDPYDNTATGFNGTVSILDGTGSISPSTSGNFTNGVRTQIVSITHAQRDVTISVNDGSGHTGTSNLFNVIPGSIDHFSITPVGVQIALTPFTITVRAEDVYNNIAESFTGTVDISDVTGTISPVVSGNFVAGQWSSGVTIYESVTANQISVVRTGGTESGTSNPFDVNAPPGIRILDFTTSQTHVTSGQEQDWTLSLVVQNLASNFANLDSLKLRFMIAGIEQSDYVLNIPQNFIQSGTPVLGGTTTDSLLITVDVTGLTAGNVTVQAIVYCLDSGTGFTVTDDAYAGITVEEPAQLKIDRVRVSQREVTRGQEEDWTATVIVKNIGGSTVAVDSSADSTFISFALGSLWEVNRPATFHGGDWILSGGEIDSLIYGIEKTGDGEIGSCDIHAVVRGVENNTGRSVEGNTTSGGWVTVLIENPASIRIVQVENLAMNAPYVNTGQDFTIRVTVENSGGDGIHNLQVFMTSDGLSIFPPSIVLQSLAGGETEDLELSGRADYSPNISEIFTAQVEAYSDNTNNLLVDENSGDNTTTAVVQNPANLTVEGVVTSTDIVVGGQVDPWTVKVGLRNTGQAAVALDNPQAEDLSFWVENLFQSDYKVTPPSVLKGGGLVLTGGQRDTLIYTIHTTGRLGGTAEIRAEIDGKDQNTEAGLNGVGTANISIQAERDFRIISTNIQTTHMTVAGDGYVNTGQDFQVIVRVENGLGETLNDIWVSLESDGASLSNPLSEVIPSLSPTEWGLLVFNVSAAGTENITGERFTASITDAIRMQSGLDAPVGPSLDSTATVIIQKPAVLEMVLELSNPDGLVSTNQVYTLKAHLDYTETGMGEVDSGQVQISLPVNHTLIGSNYVQSIRPGISAEWSIQAPDTDHPERSITVTLSELPREHNTGNTATVVQQMVGVNVTTLISYIISSLSISSPVGATDRMLSTGQSFIVKATFQRNNVKDLTATLYLPYGYQMQDNAEKSVASSEVVWQVDAPQDPFDQLDIALEAEGVDSLQESVKVYAAPVYLNVTTVRRANINLNLSIISPPDAIDGSVSLGQEFVVEAEVVNNGDAGTAGMARATLANPSSDGYIPSFPLTRDIVNGKVSWTIKAPSQPTSEAINIKASLTTAPYDENTNREAYVGQSSDGVAVTTVGAWLAVNLNPISLDDLNTAVPGENVELMSLEFQNRGLEGTNRILIDSLLFHVEDRLGIDIPPNLVFSKITVNNSDNHDELYGLLNQIQIPESNPVCIPLNQQDVTIEAGNNLRISIFGEMAEGSEIAYFRLKIPDDSYVRAKDYVSKLAVPIKNVMDQDLEDIQSDLHMVFESSSEVVLWNCPNPFGDPGNEETAFIYNLEEDTDVYFKIYTLVGELVWSSETYSASDAEGRAGSHAGDVTWDGCNDKGLPVLNGVYILIMVTGDGHILKTKIAIVR